jgi:hypothetical protein
MQKLKYLLPLILMLFIVITLSAQGFQGGPPRGDRKPPMMKNDTPGDDHQPEFKGYLVDRNWGEKGTDDRGKDIGRKPSLVTRKHLLTEQSKQSGYGILMKTPDHDSIFLRFDTSGNLRAEDYIQKSKKKSNIYVKVEGKVSGDHVLSVTNITSATRFTQHGEGEHEGQRGSGGPGGKPMGGRPMPGMGEE